jgi:molybdenum cofactor cytidylyltransferase
MTAEAGAPQAPLAGLVLAAGASRRLGQPKQLVQWRGQTLVARAVDHALALCDAGVVVVTGAHATAVAASLAELPHAGTGLKPVYNAEWEQGMGASIARGMRALRAPGVPDPAGVLTLLVDQPAIARAELVSLVKLWQTNPLSLAAARYGQRRGVPAVFPQACFAALERLTGDTGARHLLAAATGVLELAIPAAAFDIDTPEALAALAQMPADRE